jgi:PhnB protein
MPSGNPQKPEASFILIQADAASRHGLIQALGLTSSLPQTGAAMYIPPGFNTVTPYYFVKDAELFVFFLVHGLGGEETCRTMRKDGFIQNVQVRLGTSTVMVSEATKNYPPMASAFYIYVEDADAAMVRALEAGAELEMPVSDMPYR